MSCLRLVLFDIDGTLIQSGGAGQQAFECVFATRWNLPGATKEISFAGRTDWAIVRETFLRHGLEPSPENFQAFFDDYVFWLDHLLKQMRGQVLAGVHDLILRFGEGPSPPLMGLLTGNIRLGAQIKLSHFNLWHHFKMGGFGDDHEERSQVARVAVQRGTQLLNSPVPGDQILVIGDTPHDITCAQAVGARVLAVATGQYSVEQLQAFNPTWAVSDLTGWRGPNF